uniref:Non-specific serine/threonine protein kinase n=1 Tax=Heterorhabditis bacteriophora TaxID=37862 RepID=A0A1I7XJ26_HETBA
MRETMLHLFHYSSTHLKGESLLYSLVIKTINVTMSKEKVSSYLFLLRKCTELDKDYTRNCHKSDPFSILLHNVEKLKTACNVIGSLLNCNGAIQSELMRRYLPDIICAHEQFNYLNRNENITDSTYDHLLNMMDPPTLISTFLVLIKHTDSNYSPPSWFNGDKFPPDHLFHLFSVFTDEMRSKNELAANVFIMDILFRPWEVRYSLTLCFLSILETNIFQMILEGSLVNWCSGFTTSLYVLSMWCNSKICPNLILNSTRLLAICPILLDIINSTVQSIGEILDPVNRLHETILSVIRFSVQRIANLYLDSSNATRLLIEMACASVQLWEKEEVNNEAPRFVNVDEKHSGDPEFRKLTSHLMAEVFFEQLGEWDFDNTDVAVIVSIVKLVEVVLTSVRNSLEAEQDRRRMFDILEKKNTEFSQMYAIKVQTTKMAVGLAGAIVFAAIIHEEISNALSSMYSEVQNFVSFIESSNYDELSSIASDAKQLISLLQGNELQILNGPSRSSEKKTEPTDFLSELRLDLAHELPAMRGEALLRTSKMIRKRNSLVLSALSSWLFETIKELVSDYDSYVYLAAINALAEAACYDSNHLRDLIDFFKQLGAQSVPCSKNLADTEAVVLQRAKLCEVIGKVFKVLGDVAPFWLNDVAGIFLSCLRESHDIIRASALSALADLLFCCRGKGIDKYLDEILFAVDCILRSDNSSLVRRSAVNLVRQTIRSCDASILMVMGGRLRDLRRSLMHLWKWDVDHVVRLHAQLSIEEIKLALEKTVHCEIEEMKQVRINIVPSCHSCGFGVVCTMSCDIDATALIACVTEFYATNDTDRRKELDTYLCQFKSSFSCDRTVAVCILIMSPRNSPSVQYFGAISLYDTVRHRYEECIANITLMESLKKFLIDNLTTTAHVQMQSITNKLSATLALLVLYSIPDVWPQPVAYLTNIWAASPELLLRVLAEIAAEFSNIQMPLTQRSKLKTELHKISEAFEDIICIISTVMGASDASPSTRQAAVECVEQWVQLPGAGLHLWTPVLSVVFGAVAEDSAALTNLLNILASNDELTSFDQLVLDICQYITTVVSQKVLSELRADGDSEEVVALVAAVCTMAVTAVPTLIQYAKSTLIILFLPLNHTMPKFAALLRQRCHFRHQMSSKHTIKSSENNLLRKYQLLYIYIYIYIFIYLSYVYIIYTDIVGRVVKYLSMLFILLEAKLYPFLIKNSNQLYATVIYAASSSEYYVPSTLVILRRAFPMFRNILEQQGGTMAIGDRVCDAIRSAVSSLPDAHLVEVFPFVSEILARAILTNPVAGCSLAKATVLVFGGVRPTAAPLCEAIRLWFSLFEENISSGSIEDWLGLIYQVVKKDWKTLRAHGSSSLPAINSAISIAAQTLVHSNEPCVARLASQVLATISNQTTSFGDDAPRELLANIGRPLVKVCFKILIEHEQQWTCFCRSVINDLEHGDSPIVSAMFREVGNLRNFKQMTLRLNMAARKSSSVI